LLQEEIPRIFAPWIAQMGLQVLAADGGRVELRMPVRPEYVHVGGVMCGQAAMAAADTAMVLAMMSLLGEFRPMTTVQLQTSFLRPIPGNPAGNLDETVEEARVIARVLRLGKSLVFGEIEVQDPAGRLAAHATTTYALL
jgi:uncharacterized protein (TIGR00369 family)